MSNLIYKCWTKATNKESGPPRRSQNWALSRRAWFHIYDDRIECGDWVLPFDRITNAKVYITKQTLISVSVLQLEVSGQVYQFGFNPWARPISKLPLEITQGRVKLKNSPFSILVRVILVGYIVYLIWDYFYK